MVQGRRLLSRLRDMMATGVTVTGVDGVPLRDLAALVAAELVAEVCTVYAMRPGDLLELTATHGLNPDAVGRTRLRVGEGIVGIVAATGIKQNLPDAQNHPAFAYKPETGEDPFASLLAVPVRRGGRIVGVLAVQNRAPRRYDDDEVELLETVAMLLAEILAAAGASDGAEQGVGATLSRQFQASPFAPGLAIGPIVLHGAGAPLRRLLSDDPLREAARLDLAVATMRRTLDDLIETRLPDGDGPREVLEAARL
ncbi:MAG: GAF domain-containing protein, partial [Gemmatimonadaceae bacterium]|nr:GAF domain-containing protein [Acetobacteraceae bacterium]